MEWRLLKLNKSTLPTATGAAVKQGLPEFQDTVAMCGESHYTNLTMRIYLP
jgi:hypothetical protein